MTPHSTDRTNRLGWRLAAAAGAVIFAAFAIWGGIPTETNVATIFWLQAGLFLLVICAFALMLWHLLIRPLAPKLRQPQIDSLPLSARQALSLLLVSGGIAIFVGGIWDELWHRSYGIPFGEDLFWRPHLLMYFGFSTTIVTGFWALFYLNRNLRGSFQQRFRSNIIVSLLILNAAFLLYALPADPLWHWTFGEDITAWSIPHLILLLSYVITLVLAFFVHESTLPERNWRAVFRLRISESFTLVIFAAVLLLWLQLMLIDWDATLAGIRLEWLGLYRPEWLLAANLLACVTFCGVIATRVLRCAGAATASGLLALAIRYGLIQLFEAEMLQHVAWVAALLPLLAIDIWAYYCSAIRKSEPEWRGTALAVIVAMAINAPLIRSLYNLEEPDNLAYAIAIIATGFGMSWLANQVADAMRRKRAEILMGPAESIALKPAISVGVMAAFLIFIFVFIVTAAPPV
ncbi:MAG: hypothetical protein OXG78_11915 [Chloroflexi bacterium]|nr:hypothetical protein [Chloroflexota bacterium]